MGIQRQIKRNRQKSGYADFKKHWKEARKRQLSALAAGEYVADEQRLGPCPSFKGWMRLQEMVAKQQAASIEEALAQARVEVKPEDLEWEDPIPPDNNGDGVLTIPVLGEGEESGAR